MTTAQIVVVSFTALALAGYYVVYRIAKKKAAAQRAAEEKAKAEREEKERLVEAMEAKTPKKVNRGS